DLAAVKKLSGIQGVRKKTKEERRRSSQKTTGAGSEKVLQRNSRVRVGEVEYRVAVANIGGVVEFILWCIATLSELDRSSKYCDILQTVVNKSEECTKDRWAPWDAVKSQRTQATVWELGATAKLVSEALANFTATMDALTDPLPEEYNKKVQAQIEETHTTLQRAQKLAIEMEASRISARDHAFTNPGIMEYKELRETQEQIKHINEYKSKQYWSSKVKQNQNRRRGDSSSTEQSERKIIAKNVEFLEELQTDDEIEGEDVETDAISERETIQHRQDERKANQSIEEDIELKEAEISELEELIDQLERKPTCASRMFGQENLRYEDKLVACAFCEAIGVHYSDACPFIRTVEERQKILIEKGRCERCLERDCTTESLTCRKYYSKCFHCKKEGHHSALCLFPEYSDDIQAKIH
ncbi:hypothetical protein OSTOST_14546, partial [Ostertagia ostertagi]